jgi:hypothetical protein
MLFIVVRNWNVWVWHSLQCCSVCAKFSDNVSLYPKPDTKGHVDKRIVQGAYKLSEDFVTFVWITHSERNTWSRTMFTSHHFQRHYQNCESASTPQSGTSHKTCLRVSGGNRSIAWTSAVSHVERTSNAFKVTMKLQLWKYGFAKYSDNLYAPCIVSNSAFLRQASCLIVNVRLYIKLL